ncbi:tRNA ligase subunit PheS family protein, partial [Stomatobaculum longum]
MDKKQFEDLKQRFAERAAAMEQKNSETLYELRKEFLDRKDGLVSGLMKLMKSVPPEEKADFGKEVNALKDWVLENLTALEKQAREAELNRRYEAEKIDVTLPGIELQRGNLHPDTLVRNQMIEAFAGMGFEIYEGAEIETDYYNF